MKKEKDEEKRWEKMIEKIKKNGLPKIKIWVPEEKEKEIEELRILTEGVVYVERGEGVKERLSIKQADDLRRAEEKIRKKIKELILDGLLSNWLVQTLALDWGIIPAPEAKFKFARQPVWRGGGYICWKCGHQARIDRMNRTIYCVNPHCGEEAKYGAD